MSKEQTKPSNFADALVMLQTSIAQPKKDGYNPHFKNKFATLGNIWEAIRPHLSTSGIAITQATEVLPTGYMVLKTTLHHASGEKLSGEYLLNPTKSDPQGMGSAITYARRYAICAMLGIVADEDDDGNAASEGDVLNKVDDKAMDKAAKLAAQAEREAEEAEAKYQAHKKKAEALVTKFGKASSVADLDALWPSDKRSQPNYPYQDLIGYINAEFRKHEEAFANG